MTVYHAQIIVAADVHEIHICDVISHEGQFWLVPEWLDSQDGKWTKPARIVPLATMPHQQGTGYPEFVVNDPIPKSVLFGRPSPEEAHKFAIVEYPEIVFPSRRGLQ
jgi:hypothetical protein